MDEMTLEQMLVAYRDMMIELSPAIDSMEALGKRIKEHVLETGEKADVTGVTVTIRNGYTRQSWDGKALTGYAAAHPEIMQFCKESAVSPSVALKVTF